MIGEPVRGSILVGLDEEAALVRPSPRRGHLLALAHLPTIRVPIMMRRVDSLPRAVRLQQRVLRVVPRRRRFPRNHVRIPRPHTAHVRVHQAVVVVYVRVGIVLDEIEALLPAAILDRVAGLVEPEIPRIIHVSVRQIRAVVLLVELTITLLLLKLRTKENIESYLSLSLSPLLFLARVNKYRNGTTRAPLGFTRFNLTVSAARVSNHRRQFNNLRSQIILLTRIFSNVQTTDIYMYICIYIYVVW